MEWRGQGPWVGLSSEGGGIRVTSSRSASHSTLEPVSKNSPCNPHAITQDELWLADEPIDRVPRTLKPVLC